VSKISPLILGLGVPKGLVAGPVFQRGDGPAEARTSERETELGKLAPFGRRRAERVDVRGGLGSRAVRRWFSPAS